MLSLRERALDAHKERDNWEAQAHLRAVREALRPIIGVIEDFTVVEHSRLGDEWSISMIIEGIEFSIVLTDVARFPYGISFDEDYKVSVHHRGRDHRIRNLADIGKALSDLNSKPMTVSNYGIRGGELANV